MSAIRTLAKNTTVLLIASVINYILGFFTTLYTARYLGTEGFGILSLALAFTGIFGVFTDLGLGTLTVREVSRNKNLANKYIGNTAVMKLILALLTFGLVALVVYIIGYPKNVSNIIYFITFSVILTAFTGIFNSIFQAFQKMEYIAICTILNAVLMLIGVLIVAYYNLGIIILALLYFIVSGVILIVTFLIYSWKLFFPKIEVDLSFWKPTIKESLFFGLSSILIVIYFYIDSIMLSVMVGNSAVGIYNAAYKLIFVLLFIPNVFIVSIFPIMSQHFKSSKDILKLEYEKSFKYLFVIAVFIFVYGFVFADKIILVIYGTEYTLAVAALQILIGVIPIIFITSLFGNILGAIDRQRMVTFVAGLNALLNVVLNLILIPKFSYMGASAATVLTETLGFILMFIYISKYFLRLSLTHNILKTTISGILLILFVYSLKISTNWMLAAILGLFTYILLVYILKIITNEDVEIFKKIFE